MKNTIGRAILAIFLLLPCASWGFGGFGPGGGGWHPPMNCDDGEMLTWEAATNSWICGTGTGTGDLLAANNLSDVADLGTAQANLHIDSILTALGLADDATHFGTFTGTTIADNQTAKAAIQALETAVETKEATQTAASQEEAEAGTEAAIRSFSPLRISQAIASLGNVGDITSIGTDDAGAVPFLQFAWTNFGAGDANPDVSAAMQYKTIDTTTINGFDHGGGAITDGRHLLVKCGAATVFDITSSEITATNRTGDYTCTADTVLEFVYDTDQWYAQNMPDEITTVADPNANRLYGWNDTTNLPALITPSAPLEMPAGTTDLQIAAATMTKINSDTKCVTINAATASSDFPIERFPVAITITDIHVYQSGATNVIGGLDECTGAGGICTSVTAVDADITGTADVYVDDDGSLTNGGIAANNGIFWHTTSVSGTNTYLMVCFDYTKD